MKSDVFMINSEDGRLAAARYATEEFARNLNLKRRNVLRLSLLVEETLGMVKSMVDDFYGRLWFEGEKNHCEIHLQATANMNADRKEELLSVSKSGRNAAARGFMAMIGDVVSGALHNLGRSIDNYGRELNKYGVVDNNVGGFAGDAMIPIWTLQTYREDLNRLRPEAEDARAALGELEKSIVGKLADDVIVGVKGDRIELVIVKDFDK